MAGTNCRRFFADSIRSICSSLLLSSSITIPPKSLRLSGPNKAIPWRTSKSWQRTLDPAGIFVLSSLMHLTSKPASVDRPSVSKILRVRFFDSFLRYSEDSEIFNTSSTCIRKTKLLCEFSRAIARVA